MRRVDFADQITVIAGPIRVRFQFRSRLAG
jgi:hypothetical protein